MPTVKFTKTFRWSDRNGQSDRDYEKGETYKGVRKAIAEAAVKAGAGEIVGGETEPDVDEPTAEQVPA